jgi:hypothetical protein
MVIFSKTVILFLTLLISYINSGLLLNTSGQDNLTNMESSYPSSDQLSIQNIFICPISDLNFKNNLIPGKTDKFLLRIKIPCILKTGVLLIKDHQYLLKPNCHGASLFAEILGPRDISFPFNYFW